MRRFASFFSLFPLSVFVLYAFWKGSPDFERFKMAFTLGGVCAGLQLAWSLWSRSIINRVVLGVNLYLLVGALCFYLDWTRLGQQYDSLRETGVLISIFLVGVLTTAASPYGFVGIRGVRSDVVRRSVLMLLVTGLGCAASFYFRGGNLLLSAAIPIIAVQAVRRLLTP